MKAVLIPIQPLECELIAKKKKGVIVTKRKPKLETPFKCYIYCTKPRKYIHGCPDLELFRHIDGRIDCGFSFQIVTEKGTFTKDNFLSGKVFGEFVCNNIEEIDPDYSEWTPKNRYDIGEETLNATCLTQDELWRYGDGRIIYGWHISNLKIYDKPKDVREFKKGCNDMYDPMYNLNCQYCENKCYLKRAPKSWCYVEEEL